MKTMQAKELKEKLDKNEVYLIDVREKWEYDHQHIEGAHHIPLKELSLSKLKSFSKPIVIHCAAGVRSAKGCEFLKEKKSELDVYNLEGGITAWVAAGYPIKKRSWFSIISEKLK